MHKFFFTLLLFTTVNSFSQSKNDSLINTIKAADKILFTSHTDLYVIERKKSKYKHEYIDIYHDLLKNGKPNKKIIKEKVVLDSVNKSTLIHLISNQNPEENHEGAFSFIPHHTIFILKNKKWEYIDICFGCNNYNFSDGININKKTFLKSYEDWRKLEDFFRKLNLTYQLPKQKN